MRKVLLIRLDMSRIDTRVKLFKKSLLATVDNIVETVLSSKKSPLDLITVGIISRSRQIFLLRGTLAGLILE
jgi:hypothetical protein